MEDKYSKYIRLSGIIFFTFIGIILTLILLLVGLRFLFGVLDHVSWFNYVYLLFITSIPAALFITVYLVYFRRTRSHPSAVVRYISYTVFLVALVAWVFFFVSDLRAFGWRGHDNLTHYKCYNLFFLAANVGTIFLTGIMQAFTTEKEKDWMDKYRGDV